MSDYIKRDDAWRAILALEERDIPAGRYPDAAFAFTEGLVHAANKVNDIPAADVVERKRGEWIRIDKFDDDSNVQCSFCYEEFDYIDGVCYLVPGFELPLFCPNCGADMREPPKEVDT